MNLYHLAFPKDPLRNKILVYSVFILEIVQTCIITDTAFRVFGFGYGDISYFNDIGIAWFSVPIITGLVAFIAAGFYAYRISILAQSWWVASVILLLGFVQLVGAVIAAVVLKHAVLFSHLLGKDYSIATGIWNGGAAACDVLIASSMTFYLSRRGATTGVETTHVLLRRVVRLVIETGTVTAAMALLNLILSTLPGQPSYYLVTSETLAKFYSNSMMVVLNSRMRIGLENNSTTEGRVDTTVSMGRFRTTVGGGVITNRSHHTGFGTASRGGMDTDAYELGEGVMVTREQVVFPDGNHAVKKEEDSDKGTFLVM
ncbi:hypothetical protein D9613_008944 [Agrocybe pediades]|uniref:DUF6534 domain-containing protein n=1 Tax=Agrocybe pediades TaxID=84607 RepID=A0A8H4QTH6_9AGAR|nr:hypothetical protein D9613_008944 [Agrocybe pediades]